MIRRNVETSVTLACTGYVLMANLRSYPGFFFGCLVLALGTAIFKPANALVQWLLQEAADRVDAAYQPAPGRQRTRSGVNRRSKCVNAWSITSG